MSHRNFAAILMLAAAGLAAGFAPASAAAADAERAPTRVVSFADLNLATPAGRQRLELRLRAAARAVCAPLDGHDLRQRAAWRQCIARTLERAHAALPPTALEARATR